MDNQKQILGKKRQNDNIIIENLGEDTQNKNIKLQENNIIKEDFSKINQTPENLNLNLINIKNNALSFGDLKN